MSEIKTLIAIPCMDMVAAPFAYSLARMRRVGLTKLSMMSNSLVHMARNMLAAEAVDTDCDRVLWLDSDIQFTPDLMEKLSAHMDDGLDYVSGLVFKRRFPTVPILFSRLDEEGADVYTEYPRDRLFPVAGSGFGAVMTSTKMLREVFETFGSPFNLLGVHGEDASFCIRAQNLGYKLYCDSRIKVGHCGQFVFGEEYYLAQNTREASGG